MRILTRDQLRLRAIRRAYTRDVSFLLRMPAGIPGTMNRIESSSVEGNTLSTMFGNPTAYGQPVVMVATGVDTGKVRLMASGDAPASLYGFIVRPFPTQNATTSQGLGVSVPPTSGIVSIMRSGYMMVALQNTTPAYRGAPVFVRVGGATASLVLGGLEAAADATPSNTIALSSGAHGILTNFMGPADANGNTEIAFNV